MLLPVIDLHSNRDSHSCELSFDSSGDLLLTATTTILQASEVFINYGEEKTDAELMALYGYDHLGM